MPLAFPTTQEITHIVRNRAYDPSLYIGATFCPVTPEYVAEIEYDILAPSFGMTKPHNLNSNPTVIDVPTMGTKRFGTGYWKETATIKEDELLKARAAGSYNQRAGRDLVMLRAVHMDTRLETRLEWLRWQVPIYGQVVVDDNNVKYNVNYNIPSSNLVDISTDSARKWTATTADPQSDFDAWVKLFRGTGAAAKTVYFNSDTASKMAQNQKLRDLLKQCSFAPALSTDNINQALKLLFPKLTFVSYDGGYLDENNNFQMFIPDGYLVIMGDYVGEKLMDFVTTLSLHNGGIDKPQPGKFSIIEDKSQAAKNPHVDLTVGIYGLPRLFHPNWIVRAKVY